MLEVVLLKLVPAEMLDVVGCSLGGISSGLNGTTILKLHLEVTIQEVSSFSQGVLGW